MRFNRLLRNLKKASALGIIASMLVCMQVKADVIIQPGVVIGGSTEGPGVTDESTAADNSENAADNQKNAAGNQENAADNPGAFGEGGNASQPTGENEQKGAETAPVDYAALSRETKNTVVSTNEVNIVYINGRQIDLSRPLLALTYDDGPHTPVGNRIMDIMAQYGQKCTFFMVGDRVSSRAAEVQRMAAEGHELANHTYSHVYLNKVGADTIRSQVDKCNTVIAQTAGVTPTVMRLPGGNKNQTVLSNVNMPIILWNIDTRDWATRNAEKTKAAVIGKVKSGDIVLMHELYDSTADATSVIVPTLVEQGYQLVTVSELAALKNVTLEPNKVYYSF